MPYETHHDPIVDKAHRANAGAGFHFFEKGNSRFHKSKSVSGVLSSDGRYAFVVERYGTVYFGRSLVQVPHSRVVRVDLKSGETDYLTREGKPTSEMVNGAYVNNGEKAEYRTNAQALKAARTFAGEV